MKVGLDWQKKTIVIFAVMISLLSILLTILAIRAAERERLVMEREIEEEQRGLADLIVGQVRAIISELEGRIDRLLRSYQIQSQEKELAKVCRRITEGEEIVTEIFLVDEKREGIFPLAKPLFLSAEAGRNIAERPVDLKSDPLWDRAEMSEFRTKDYAAAVQYYQKLLDATSVYRGALVNRIGRCYKKSGEYANAIEAYQKILKEYANEVSFDGIPLAIIAQYQIGDIYLATGRKIEGVEALLELYNGLLRSKWLLNRSQFYFYLKKVKALITDHRSLITDRRLAERWDRLRQLEGERSSRTNTIENLRQKIIPLIKTKVPVYSAAPSTFYHISDTIGEELYLISYTPVPPFEKGIHFNSPFEKGKQPPYSPFGKGDGGISRIGDKVLGIMIDAEAIARKFLPSMLSILPLRKGWHVQITDRSGTRLAGEDVANLSGLTPQLTFSKDFDDDFPPWKVDIYQSDPGSLRRLSRLKRNIYILSVAVVISVIIFGGYWAISSTAKELKLANLKSEFVSTVSHELRTPLTSIRYLAELLQRGRVDGEERKQEYYETITNESEHLSRLIDNILDFSKIEAGMKEYHFADTDIAELATDVASQFQEQVAQDEFILKSDISNGIPKVSADMEAISQALFNLLDNAFKYSGESREIFLSAWSDEDSVFLEVRDEGIGISNEEQKNVFENFYRSEYLRDSNIRGSGIGLTLVAYIVKAHGGEVLLESDLGKGTKVVMKLPVRRKVDKDGQDSNRRG